MPIRTNKQKCEFDSTRNTCWGGCSFECRTISAHGWRCELFYSTLLTLQRYDIGSGDRATDFSLLLKDANLKYVDVGARTAQEMGIADYMNVKLIPEAGYLDLINDLYSLPGRL